MEKIKGVVTLAITAINISDARKYLKRITDDVVAYDDHVIITKPHNKNVVIISESEFKSMQETLYLLSSDANQKALNKSIDQMNASEVKSLSMEAWNAAGEKD